ncbi:MAG: hypothetical protein JST47_15235 [Bacteroidetes bacterium]|nr:hypothetical protein [Bacteroidota bacterium]MBS1974905.1 hypothetical protein [Bacteroidota bacterium]
MLLNIVTDEQLLISQIVKTVLLCLVGLGIVYNLSKIIRTKENIRRIISCFILLVLCVAAFFTAREYRIESPMLSHPKYVQGTTIGYCNVTGLGLGIEFEYEVNGQVFRNCNTFYPVPRDNIVVPKGKYMVRYSEKYVEDGRMDFNKAMP